MIFPIVRWYTPIGTKVDPNTRQSSILIVRQVVVRVFVLETLKKAVDRCDIKSVCILLACWLDGSGVCNLV
jgi:hypothetical protein